MFFKEPFFICEATGEALAKKIKKINTIFDFFSVGFILI
jgi:hypothetical protein